MGNQIARMTYAWRAGLWYLNARTKYTRLGFEAASQNFDADALDVDLAGKTYVVTGANSGIGFCTAKALAARGGKVYMCCRSVERGEAARAAITADSSPCGPVEVVKMDMGSSADIAAFCQQFSGIPLHGLILNAGCMMHTREVNERGIEANFAVNVLGPYQLTLGLLPALDLAVQSKCVPRVLFVSSGGMLTEKLDPSDLMLAKWSSFDGTRAYSLNKRAQVLLAERWSADNNGIFFASMHPGWSDTDAVKNAMPEFYEQQKETLRTADQGADTVIWLAASDGVDLKRHGGEFFEDRLVVSKHLWGCWTDSSKEDVDVLIAECERLTVPIS